MRRPVSRAHSMARAFAGLSKRRSTAQSAAGIHFVRAIVITPFVPSLHKGQKKCNGNHRKRAGSLGGASLCRRRNTSLLPPLAPVFWGTVSATIGLFFRPGRSAFYAVQLVRRLGCCSVPPVCVLPLGLRPTGHKQHRNSSRPPWAKRAVNNFCCRSWVCSAQAVGKGGGGTHCKHSKIILLLLRPLPP